MNNTQQTIEELERINQMLSSIENGETVQCDGDEIFNAIRNATALIKQQDAIAQKWVSVDERLPEIGDPVIGYSPDWINGDFNIKGVRECHVYDDGTIWQSARWNDYQDRWVTADEAPTHWMPLPQPPESRIYTDADIAGSDELPQPPY